ncbi:MAG: nickel pincer cofactor biosynthesis protein LarB [Kiritimatiellae bacterium]|nr:nickel pincer cofactor biosynthesis protein LarB [Kiritimatiellia bacterium]
MMSCDIDNLGFARVDLQRKARQGIGEVIYGEGKSAGQIIAILKSLDAHSQRPALVTRLDSEKASIVKASFGEDFSYFPVARFARLGEAKKSDGLGFVAVVCGGTSDIAVAEEAALTLEALGNEVKRIYDVGVAGLHRLLACEKELKEAKVIIAVAGMEGALPSVIGGLVHSPIIAVPTSVGYGASFGGVSALLAMLNSCASGVAVVNIDNGFGAGILASKINHIR